jgi:MFS family permease
MPLAGTYLGLGVGVGLGLGMLFGGFLGNRAAQRDVGLPLKVCTVSLVLSLPFALASLFVSSVHHAILLVSLAELCAGMSAGPVVSAVCGVVRPTTRATAVAITTFFASVLGFGLGPYCVGVLSDMLSSSFGAQSLRYALIAPVCMLPVMAFGLYGAAKRLPVDLKLTAAQADAVPFLQTSGGSLLNTKE